MFAIDCFDELLHGPVFHFAFQYTIAVDPTKPDRYYFCCSSTLFQYHPLRKSTFAYLFDLFFVPKAGTRRVL